MNSQELTKGEVRLQRALKALVQARARVTALEARETEPIAVISMACRLPGGVASPEDLWTLLAEGRDAVGPFPARWSHLDLFDADPETIGKAYATEGGFVEHLEEFDAALFGISPREAETMEPQQRLLLELAWEAFERSHQSPIAPRARKVGVYVGAMRSDYGPSFASLDALDGYHGTGISGSVVSGRIAYSLGLDGPAVTIDTACSSSLVAIHNAMRALRSGECDSALAGGVTVMCGPGMFVESSRFGAMSPDGRCKSFGSGADGGGWAEGAGLVMLKRLSDARADGDKVLAVLRGSAVNQDGRSAGLTVPHGPAQTRVIRAALAEAALDADAIDAIDAHGTGTRLGDPIEAEALAEVFRGRSGSDVWLGSLKSNVGHAQAAAGVLSVIKMVLAMQHEELPRTLHVETPSPLIDWAGSGLQLLQEAQPWPRGDRTRRAGVSSFGISGTNAHLVIEEAEAVAESGQRDGADSAGTSDDLPELSGFLPFLLSSATEQGLRLQADRWAQWLQERSDADLHHVRAVLSTRRAELRHRAAVTATSRTDIIRALQALAVGDPSPDLITATSTDRGRVVFVYPGHGSQWREMGQTLLKQSNAFAAVVDECDAAFRAHLGLSVRDALEGTEDPDRPFERMDVVQPLLFTMAVGITAVWRDLGIEPDAVFGSSQGEVAAAVTSGALTIAEAAAVVSVRSTGLEKHCRDKGAMAVIGLSGEAVEDLVSEHRREASVAIINSPASTVVAGTPAAVDAIIAKAANLGAYTKRIDVSAAGHSPQMDPILPGMRTALADLKPHASRVPFYSTVRAQVVAGTGLDADYWCANLRETVRVDRVLELLASETCDVFIEMSPHPLLATPISEAVPAGVIAASMRKGRGDLSILASSLGELWCHGMVVDWERLVAPLPPSRQLPQMPTYAFDRRRHWYEAPTSVALAPSSRARDTGPETTQDASAAARSLPDAERLAWLTGWVAKTAAAVIGAHEAVEADRRLSDLGFDSIMALRLRNRLTTLTGIPVPANLGRTHPSAAALAGWLNERWDRAAGADPVAVDAPRRETGRSTYPATDGQQRLWFLEKLSPGSRDYTTVTRVQLPSDTDLDLLRSALDTVAVAHEALRTRLDMVDGQLVQRVTDDLPTWESVAAASHGESESAPFVLKGGPLVRAVVSATEDGAGWLLSLVIHHAVIDGWSLSIVLSQLRGAYAELVAGRTPEVPTTLQFGDVALWEASADHAEDVGWFVEDLRGLAPQLLPALGRSVEPGWITFDIDAETRDAVQEWAERCETTSFAAWALATAVTLAQHTGQEDVCMGTIWANRGTAAVEDCVGFFANTLPLRCDLSGAVSGEGALTALGERVSQVMVHQQASLSEIVAKHRAQAGHADQPMKALFNYRATGHPELDGGWMVDERGSLSGMVPGASKAAVGVTLAPSVSGLRGEIEFGEGALDALSARDFASALQSTARTLAANPKAPVLGAMSAAVGSANPTHDLPPGVDEKSTTQLTPVLSRVLAQADQRPDAVAVVGPDGTELTYRQLVQRARAIADELVRRGAVPGGTVGICLPRSTDLPVGVLAAWLCGCAFLPIDPDYPSARVEHVLQDSGVSLVLSSAPTAGAVPASVQVRLDLLDLESVSAELADGTAPEDLAYVIYTSGSTGKPKGVMVEQRNLANFCSAMDDVVGGGPGDTWLAVTSISFDISILELVWTLTRGYRVLVADLAQADWEAAMAFHPTHLQCTPTHAKMFMADSGGRALLGGLRHLLVGGEALNPVHAARLLETCGGRVTNMYGPTETTIWSSTWEVAAGEDVSLGEPIRATSLSIVDDHGQPVPDGEHGELVIGGAGVVRGYHRRAELTSERFTTDPITGERTYGTGDVVRRRADGSLEFAGRRDGQVKLRGHRIELGEVEFVAAGHPGVADCVAVISDDALHLFWTASDRGGADESLRAHLGAQLPNYMVPTHVVRLDALPTTPNGKVDRIGAQADAASLRGVGEAEPITATATHPSPMEAPDGLPPTSTHSSLADLERAVLTVWEDLLGTTVNPDVGVFDQGATSALLVTAHDRLCEVASVDFPLAALFHHPTPRKLAEHLRDLTATAAPEASPVQEPTVSTTPGAVAVVGISCRFPGAGSRQEFWDNLQQGRESIRTFSDAELRAAGVSEDLLASPDLVRRRGVLDNIEMFDPEFFGLSDAEAEATDPQHRFLMECSWEAIEDAGYVPDQLDRVGVFASAGFGGYPRAEAEDLSSFYRSMTGTQSDYLATRVAYALGLTGPAMTVQTACSSGLVATHLAVQSLRNADADVVLVGAASITTPVVQAFAHQEGMVMSADGSCRAFDEDSDGTVFSSGAGVVVLRRLEDALAAGDRIYGVITGSAVTNDGRDKVGYTAPGVSGQIEAVSRALGSAGVGPSDVGLIEAHGTATALGDAIEIRALQEVFGSGERDVPCELGSVKTNIGHTDATAGLAGLIKAVLSVHHRQIVPNVHFTQPNPNLGLDPNLFTVSREAHAWPDAAPVRAGVSSFGIGGTNAHVVIEAAPELPTTEAHGKDRGAVPIVLSAQSEESLRAQAVRWADHLQRGSVDVHEVSRSAAARGHHRFRAVVHAESVDETVAGLHALAEGAPHAALTSGMPHARGRIAFVYPGQGGQWAGMAEGLLADSPAFAATLRACDQAFAQHLDWSVLDAVRVDSTLDTSPLDVAQVLQFSTYLALTSAWAELGIAPDVVVGHSQGEIAAAVVAGALDLAEGARLVVARARALMSAVGQGAMAFADIPLAEATARVKPYGERLQIAVVNTADSVVVAGEPDAVDDFLAELDDDDIPCGYLDAPVASHCALMDGVIDELAAAVGDVRTATAQLPIVSPLTGHTVTGDDLGLAYWGENLRRTVRFDLAQQRLRDDGVTHFVEVSPHPTLVGSLTDGGPGVVMGSLTRGHGRRGDLLRQLASGWVSGLDVDWSGLLGRPGAQRIDLPHYAFNRRRFWLDRAVPVQQLPIGRPTEDLTYEQRWEPITVPSLTLPVTGTWILVGGDTATGADLGRALRDAGLDVVSVQSSADRHDLAARLRDVASAAVILSAGHLDTSDDVLRSTEQTLALLQACADLELEAPLWVLTRAGVQLRTDDRVRFDAAAVHGLARVAVLEHPSQWGGVIDLDHASPVEDWSADVIALVSSQHDEDEIALRDGQALARRLAPLSLPTPAADDQWRTTGTVLVAGGQGALGLHLARWFVDHGAERVVLASRREDATPQTLEWAETIDVPVEVRACDLADSSAVAALIADVDATGPELRCVANLAGVSTPRALAELTAAQLATECCAKASGSINLDRALGQRELDAFLFYSSGAAFWGGGGQSAYAAANAVLEGVAHDRNARGLAATVIHWGGWSGGGMVTAEAEAIAASRGLRSLTPSTALAALNAILLSATADVAVVDMDWRTFADTFEARRTRPLLDGIPAARERGDIAIAADIAWPPTGTPDEQLAAALTMVTREVATVLGTAPEPDEQLRHRGFDSLMAVTVRTRLVQLTGVGLKTAHLTRAGTCEGIARLLVPALDVASVAPTSAPSWLRTLNVSSAPTARVVCLAGMGGTTGTFQALAQHLGSDVEVLGVQLPGREDRVAEAAPEDTMGVADHVVAELFSRDQLPLVLVGHSQGAWLGWEIAHRLNHRPGAPIHALVAACALPPSEPSPPALQTLTDAVVQDSELSGERAAELMGDILPRAITSDEDLLTEYLKRLRTDAELAARHRDAVAAYPRFPLRIPVRAVSGSDDPVLSAEQMQVWRDCTVGTFEADSIHGSHAAPLDNPREMAEQVLLTIADLENAMTTTTEAEDHYV